MQVPTLKGAKIASCVGCGALASLSVSLVSYPCPVLWIAAAI